MVKVAIELKSDEEIPVLTKCKKLRLEHNGFVERFC